MDIHRGRRDIAFEEETAKTRILGINIETFVQSLVPGRRRKNSAGTNRQFGTAPFPRFRNPYETSLALFPPEFEPA
jgi:hypothetical protein